MTQVLQHKCSCGGHAKAGGECEECRKKRSALQRKAAGAATAEPALAPPIVHTVLRQPGRPLDAATRSSMERSFGHDFSNVRLHADGEASRSARSVQAIAYTVGSHVALDASRLSPSSRAGRFALAHELAHVVQQRSSGGGSVPADLAIRNSPSAEADADLAAHRALRHQPIRSLSGRVAEPALLRLTPAQFRRQLGSTPEQTLALDHVFADPTFVALWDYLAACTATPAQDLGPLALRVTPGLTMGGVVRFGGYFGLTRTLEINPTKPEHLNNPAELVDTLVHEFIHAVDDLQPDCRAAGAGAAPLRGAATDTAPSRAAVGGTAREARLAVSHGPSASNPCGEFIDINQAAQQMIVQILQGTIAATGVGQPTLTFVNEIIRHDPAAMASYEACRGTACALATPAARDAAIARCSKETIATFLPSRLRSTLLPAHVQFATGSTALSPPIQEKLEMIALFLIAHPAVSVDLEGHTDIVGSGTDNLTLGQIRAEAVAQELLRLGVPAAQIRRVTSAGETRTISTSRSERFRDRRVEIRP